MFSRINIFTLVVYTKPEMKMDLFHRTDTCRVLYQCFVLNYQFVACSLTPM